MFGTVTGIGLGRQGQPWCGSTGGDVRCRHERGRQPKRQHAFSAQTVRRACPQSQSPGDFGRSSSAGKPTANLRSAEMIEGWLGCVVQSCSDNCEPMSLGHDLRSVARCILRDCGTHAQTSAPNGVIMRPLSLQSQCLSMPFPYPSKSRPSETELATGNARHRSKMGSATPERTDR